jgi:predicted DsbA family dithiol-disulfide isomerase
LAEGRYTDRVIEQEQFAAQIGVTAVPTIVIGQVGVQGAQPYDVLRQVYEEAQRRATEGEAVGE